MTALAAHPNAPLLATATNNQVGMRRCWLGSTFLRCCQASFWFTAW
jgi:hypothetical protein